MEYIVDDHRAFSDFVGSLNRKVLRQRFSSNGQWAPDRTVLAIKDGRPVALADCVLFPAVGAANASLLAEPGSGAYALKALLHLKGLVAATHWQSTLRVPTPATMAISRRFFDSTLDQAAWEISSKLMETHGPQAHLRPTPLVASTSFLRLNGLPTLSKWSELERAVSADPSRGALTSPAGFEMGAPELMVLAFKLLDLPFEVRQHVTRTMLLGLASMHGHDVAPFASKVVQADAIGKFFALNAPYRSGDPGKGLFAFREMDKASFQQALAKAASGDFPSKRTGN